MRERPGSPSPHQLPAQASSLSRSAWLRGAVDGRPGWHRDGAHHRLWVTAGGSVAMVGEDSPRVLWQHAPAGSMAADLDEDGAPDGVEVFLGRGEDGPLVAVVVPDEESLTLPAGSAWRDLKVVGTGLSEGDRQAAMTAVALARWHQRHRYSPTTGEETEVVASGWVRRESSGELHFPRTDTAVIMAVVDDRDRLLLARGSSWPAGRLSVLAGFVEPGETLEEAVAREVHEEVSVELPVSDVRYFGSQPWPFPASLMVGFTAQAGSQPDQIEPQALEHDEIAEAHWFSREELERALAAQEVGLPGPFSIARRLIEHWYGGPLPVVQELRGSVRG
ncbi:NAD(+) diphosphatase [Kytococcus sedentarius]|uniref:NAD(+) diphosphatase n=1 Tax=Kytococcus sedentarius TaxID=1276 RepID=UPI0035BC3F65